VPQVTTGTQLHDKWMLPHFVWQDFQDVIEEMNLSGYPIEADWFLPHREFRFPFIGKFNQRGVDVELRSAGEPWYVLGEEGAQGGTARYVDSSVERLQVKVRNLTDPRYVLTCNGRCVPLHPTGVQGEFVAGVRYRAWQPPSCLHPTIPVDGPLVFDLFDTWMHRSMGGCQWHVGHPGGLNPTTFPVNALEAETRRATRYFNIGHTPGVATIGADEPNPEFPLTLDLRRGRA
ncbi:MAG: transglutaminase family protein, partial [Planctomycetota bacterium]